MMTHMSQTKQPPGRELYERDEHEWIAAQISALESGQWNRLDRANLIEFLSETTISDRRELRSRLTVAAAASAEGPISAGTAFGQLGEHHPGSAERDQIAH
jgi:hypothetical protein